MLPTPWDTVAAMLLLINAYLSFTHQLKCHFCWETFPTPHHSLRHGQIPILYTLIACVSCLPKALITVRIYIFLPVIICFSASLTRWLGLRLP